jgi:transcription factor C subunit 7
MPLGVDKWPEFFPGIEFQKGETGITTNPRGETLDGIHQRTRTVVDMIIRYADEMNLQTIVLCTHAATNIALGRALTGDPDVNILS